MIHNIVPLSVDHTLFFSFFFIFAIADRAAAFLAAPSYHMELILAYLFRASGFSNSLLFFPINRQRLTRHVCGFVVVQVHTSVLLYNYYHWKQFPQLEFASPLRFCMSASLTVTNKNLLMYLNHPQNRKC